MANHNQLKRISTTPQANTIPYADENGYLSAWLDNDPVITALKGENEFIGTAMREYDVDTYYKWDPNTDTLLVTFNFGNAKLVFKDFTKNVKIKNVKGWWEDKLEAEMTPELEKFTEDVSNEWQDCFGY